ncbi:hypothetical protein B0O80DRAFT_170210 [Mortierella sp. GBAus27b]|nr:hypothetical protein B0O80DRAFT_170210 [Mortierella sp. GBAus27b]
MDIQLLFKDIRHIMHGNSVVHFMVDDDSHDLLPLRIRHYPGTVLEIVETDMAQDRRHADYHAEIASRANLESHTLSGPIHPQPRSPLYTYIKQCESILNTMIPNQFMQAPIPVMVMDDILESMLSHLSKYRILQDHLLKLRGLVGDLHSGSQQGQDHEISNEQQRILLQQQESVDSLVHIQSSIEDVTRLAFMAQEYPIPRLFVVLPMTSSSARDKEMALLTPEFRLYFICEPDHQKQHTSTDGEPSSDKIHLARHQGYDLVRIEEFFDIYGGYIQAIACILENGIVGPDIHIPSMTHLTLAEGISDIRDTLDLSANSIQSLMQETIAYIRSQNLDTPGRVFESSPDSVLDLLESTDLRHVVQYLKDYQMIERRDMS